MSQVCKPGEELGVEDTLGSGSCEHSERQTAAGPCWAFGFGFGRVLGASSSEQLCAGVWSGLGTCYVLPADKPVP